MHTTMVAVLIATATEAGVVTVNQHHGITIPVVIKVKLNNNNKKSQLQLAVSKNSFISLYLSLIDNNASSMDKTVQNERKLFRTFLCVWVLVIVFAIDCFHMTNGIFPNEIANFQILCEFHFY